MLLAETFFVDGYQTRMRFSLSEACLAYKLESRRKQSIQVNQAGRPCHELPRKHHTKELAPSGMPAGAVMAFGCEF